MENCREPCRINGFFSTGPCAFHRKFSQSTVEKIFSFKKPQIFHKNYLTFHKPLWKTFGATKSTARADKKRHGILVMHSTSVHLRSNAQHGFRAYRTSSVALHCHLNAIYIQIKFYSIFFKKSQGPGAAPRSPAAAGETPAPRTARNPFASQTAIRRWRNPGQRPWPTPPPLGGGRRGPSIDDGAAYGTTPQGGFSWPVVPLRASAPTFYCDAAYHTTNHCHTAYKKSAAMNFAALFFRSPLTVQLLYGLYCSCRI